MQMLAFLFALAAAPATEAAPAPEKSAAAALVIGGALSDPALMSRLQELTDTVGPRLSGSRGAEAAVQWALAAFRADGLSAHLEPTLVPHWVRGEESGFIVAEGGRPQHPLALTALGSSAPTPDGGLTAEVLEVRSLGEVAALGERARGKIILFQHEMRVAEDYGMASTLRTRGPSAAAKVGAAAALVRSAASASMRSPHTGVTVFDPGQAPIPAAALSVEDAQLLERLAKNGPVKIQLKLGCRTLPDAPSHNVVAELRGREKPEEVVLIGAHLDSWDLATGAIDDGAGVVIAMQALRTLSRLPRPPRRTVRAVLYMNEENGGRGSKAYAQAHAAELGKHVAALEADSGAGRPLSVEVALGAHGAEVLGPWMAQLAGLGVLSLGAQGHGGADISILSEQAAVPMAGVRQDGARYFDWHHSAADTLDKVDPKELAASAAAYAWVLYALAESEQTLARVKPEKPRR